MLRRSDSRAPRRAALSPPRDDIIHPILSFPRPSALVRLQFWAWVERLRSELKRAARDSRERPLFDYVRIPRALLSVMLALYYIQYR
jgi:hypothetical protein